MKEDQNKITKEIEALLFYLSIPVSIGDISKILDVPKDKIKEAIIFLKEKYKESGINIIEHQDEVTFVTSPDCSSVIDKIIEDEQKRDIGKAGIETLSIIAYKGPVTRREIEYIRGVNCQFALRNLLIRGLKSIVSLP